ncbi:hypothetical protein EDD85DRAFT_84611 [Armillaria nabsnona]|nr:hypothetical protein EDD85DRAFT_84611 [Armillaria nabsnona]
MAFFSEVFSGKPPFHHIKTDPGVILEVVEKKKYPPRPSAITDDLWSLVTACLTFVPSQRLHVKQILEILQKPNLDDRVHWLRSIFNLLRPSPPGNDQGVDKPQNQAADGPAKATPPPSPPQCVPIEQSLFALVIGIDEYADPDVHDLTSAVADAGVINDFLQKTLHVPEHQIKNLRNKDATRVTIEEEIKNFGDNPAIKKGDPILIFYAGHRADVNAPPEWPTGSADGKIQMLVPHDFNLNGSDNSKRGQGVLDVRLSHLLQDIADKKSDNITVILDCGPESRKSEKGKRGVFTSALLGVLEQHKDRIDKLTYKDVIDNLDLPEEQDLQCDGDQFRYLFSSRVASRSREIYPIRAFQPEDRDFTLEQYVLEAGEAHGITKNAEFVVFANRTKASESAWETRSALGTVVAVNTTAFTTTCDFSPRGDKTQPFPLSGPGCALQTRVGDGQDVRLSIELALELIPVFEQIAKETKSSKAAKRAFLLVDSRDDKPDLVVELAADRKHIRFEITENDCRRHGLAHMPFEVNIDDLDSIQRILRGSADFYWHLLRSSEGSPLAGKVNLECMKLIETEEYIDDLEAVLMPDPNGENLNIGGVIMIDVGEDAIYGFKITNSSAVPLYVSMFYFDISDLSINSYYQPGYAKKHADVSLLPCGELTIGYGASRTVPPIYTLREGQYVNVGFLKLFFSTEYIDLSGVVQRSAFDNSSTPPSASLNYTKWSAPHTPSSSARVHRIKGILQDVRMTPRFMHTMCVPVVQTKGGGAS